MKKILAMLKGVIAVMLVILTAVPVHAETPTYAETDFEYDLTIESWDGNTYTPADFSEEYVLLIFGRQACGNTQAMIREAQKLLKLGADVKPVVMLIDANSEPMPVEEFAAGLDGFVVSDAYSYNSSTSRRLMSSAGIAGSVLPFVFLMDSRRHVILGATGPSHIYDISAAIPYDQDTDAFIDVTVSVSLHQDECRDMLKLVNDFRTGDGAWIWDSYSSDHKQYFDDLQELVYDYELEKIAIRRAEQIAVYYSHEKPDGRYCFEEYTGVFANGYMAENIAVGYPDDESVFTAWKEEDKDYYLQGHRRNMLSSNARSIGIACAEVNGVKYWVQEFSDVVSGAAATQYSSIPYEKTIRALKEYMAMNLNWTESHGYWDQDDDYHWDSIQMTVGDVISLPEAEAWLVNSTSSRTITGPVEADFSYSLSGGTAASIQGNELHAVSAGSCQLVLSTDYYGIKAEKALTVDVVEPHVHEYRLDSWSWAYDHSSAYALFVCASDSSHTVRVTAAVAAERSEPECEKGGHVKYTATCEFEGKRYTDVYESDLPAKGHSYGFADWVWASDYSYATITVACDECGFVFEQDVPSVRDGNKYTASIKIGTRTYSTTVYGPSVSEPESVSVSPDTLSLKTGETAQLSAAVEPTGADQRVEWQSSDDSVAAVSSSGLVTAKRPGKAVITAVTYNGKLSASCQLTVEEPEPEVIHVTGISLSEDYMVIPAGSSAELTAEVVPADADDRRISWTSENPQIAEVDENGNVKANSIGTTVIHAVSADGGFEAQCTVKVLFSDVPDDGRYYFTPVYWAVDRGITNGYRDSDGLVRTFRPQNNCTREAIVTFLWRLEGKPEPENLKSPFRDVQNRNAYYYKAVLWAAEKGITKGYSDGTFKPDATCLREHVVTFLYRYAGKPNIGTSTNPFNDIRSSDYYYKPVLWAVSRGITNGYSSGPNAGGFGPKLDCLREHVVTFLYRYAK
ncbi:MAG: Ig-like domain-containing protein [Solobacterium sp.]|nr:Ig-like domain-containing protein [Solobacterium sp.]